MSKEGQIYGFHDSNAKPQRTERLCEVHARENYYCLSCRRDCRNDSSADLEPYLESGLCHECIGDYIFDEIDWKYEQAVNHTD